MNVQCNHATLKSEGQDLVCATCPARWFGVKGVLTDARGYRLAGEPESVQVTRLQNLVDYLEKRVEEEWLRAERTQKSRAQDPPAVPGDCPVGHCGGPSSEKKGHCITMCIVCWADTLQKAADLVPEEDVATRVKFAEYINNVRSAITVNDVTPRRPRESAGDIWSRRWELWAHIVSAHCNCIGPTMSIEEMEDFHRHEHAGPGTIRDHDETSRHYTLAKLGQVLSEADDDEAAVPRRPPLPVETLKDVLRAAEETLSLCVTFEHPGHPEVKALCERLGHGFVMYAASNEWKKALTEKDVAGGYYTVGPDENTARRILSKIREAL